MKWYRSLSIQQRINMKALSETITGIPFTALVSLFGLRQSIEMIHEKLKMEGFNV